MAIKFLNTVAVDTDVLYVDASNDRVGIGTPSPASKLHVSGGDIRLDFNERLQWDNGNTRIQGSSDTRMYLRAPLGYYFETNGGYRVAIDGSSGNVGIGTTSPSSKLQVNGDLTVGDDSTVGSWINVIAAGASQDAGIRFGSESNTDSKAAIYTNTSNSDLHFDVTETTRMLIDSGTGNVGIGTTSPGYKLDVAGDLRVDNGNLGSTSGDEVEHVKVQGHRHFLKFKEVRTANNSDWINTTFKLQAGVDSTNHQSIDFVADGSYHEHIDIFTGNQVFNTRFTHDGKVGIGTTSPSEKLHVYNGKAYVTPISYASNQSAYALKIGAYNNTAFDMGLQAKSTSGGSPYMSLRTPSNDDTLVIWGDKVGIKTAPNLSYNLDINGTLRTVGDSYFDDDIHLGRYIFHAGDTNTWLGFPTSDTISFRTNGSDRMYINSSGNVGIGTTSPTSIFHVKQTLASPSVPMVYFEADRGPSTFGAVNVRVDNLDYGTGMKFVKSGIYDSNAVAFYNGSSTVGNISINTSSTSYNTTSDYRLKENLTKITNGIDRIKQLKPKRFNFIGNEQVVDGFIAHEAKEVVPESVTGEKDEVLPNGDPLYQGIDQAKLVPLLTAALQEAITKIEVLENRLQTLENK